MVFFKRKKPVQGDPRWLGWPDTLDVNDSADVEWIKRSNDPLVWHAAALACLIFSGDKHDLIAWLVQQAGLDRVTAAAMFLHNGNGVSFLTGDHLDFVQMKEPQVAEMIDRLCDLSSSQALEDNGIGMGSGWEDARQETVKKLAGHPRAPMGILGRPIDRQTTTMPYTDIGEGDLVSLKFMRESMPFLFD